MLIKLTNWNNIHIACGTWIAFLDISAIRFLKHDIYLFFAGFLYLNEEGWENTNDKVVHYITACRNLLEKPFAARLHFKLKELLIDVYLQHVYDRNKVTEWKHFPLFFYSFSIFIPHNMPFKIMQFLHLNHHNQRPYIIMTRISVQFLFISYRSVASTNLFCLHL